MGLVALKSFIGNDGRRYEPGEPCDEALRWRYPALRACLNQGIIEDTTGEVDKHFGAPSLRERAITKNSPPSLTLADVAAQEIPRQGTALVEAGIIQPNSCTDCGRAFDSGRALSMHRLKSHKKGADRA